MSAQVAELKQRVSDLEDENAEAGYAREAAERLAQECQAQLADIKGVLEATASGTDAQRVEQLEGAIIELQSQLAAAQEAGETISEDEANLSAELASIRIATDAAVLEGAGHAALIGEANASLAAAQAQIEFLLPRARRAQGGDCAAEGRIRSAAQRAGRRGRAFRDGHPPERKHGRPARQAGGAL